MNLINIYPARIRFHSRAYTKSELIAVIAAIAIYFAVNLIMQKLFPEMNQKKINIISLIPAVIVAFIIIFRQ